MTACILSFVMRSFHASRLLFDSMDVFQAPYLGSILLTEFAKNNIGCFVPPEASRFPLRPMEGVIGRKEVIFLHSFVHAPYCVESNPENYVCPSILKRNIYPVP